ncbi:MAG: hypothetical protein ACI4RT_03790 [Candidatus Spyradenecus sp.]
MATSTITVTCAHCGKEFEKTLTGRNRDEAIRKAEWAAKQAWTCDECYKAEQAAKREAEAKAAAEHTAAAGIDLDALTIEGTEKQVKWARDILTKGVADLTSTYKFNADGLAVVAEAVKGFTDAREIIDNRGNIMGKLISAMKAIAAKRAAAPAPTEEAPAKAPETAKEAAPAPAAVATTPATEEAPKKAAKQVWRKVAIDTDAILHKTENSVLIQMPFDSKHEWFKFWTSKRLIREGRTSLEVLLSVNAEMKFSLFKNGRGRYNTEQVLDRREITADELAEAFGGYVTEAPNTYHAPVDPDRVEIIRHVPAPLAPVENAEADPELVR